MLCIEAVSVMILEPIGAAKIGGTTFTRKRIDTADPNFCMPAVKWMIE
jgi:hypothetical protein